MTFKTLAEALESAIAQGLGIGDEGIAVPTKPEMDDEKAGSANLPPASRQEVKALPTSRHRKDANRGLPTASKASAPHAPAVGRPMLVLVEGCGGSPEGGGGQDFRRYRSSRGGAARELGWVVHAST
jgi:hypothetical protein